MVDLKKLAIDSVSGCPLMVGRSPVKTTVLVDAGVVTIDQVDLINVYDKKTQTNKPVAVLTFAGRPDQYYMAGSVMTKVVQVWVDGCDGDIVTVNKALLDTGVKVRFRYSRTRDGNQIVIPDFV